MTIGELFRNGTGHFKTITRHKAEVMKNCFRIGLYWQGLLHDLSKYTPEEFLTGVFYYQGNRSPNAAEKEVRGYSVAWLHHKGRNRHHYEYWNDYRAKREEGKPPVVYVPMPRRYVAEMLMDRIAASKNYMKERYTRHEPLKYYLNGKGRKLLHPKTARELEKMLRILDQRGEEAMYRYVRDYYLKGYPV